MNDSRAAWADQALIAFRSVTRTDPQDALPDLLADLMHWCDHNSVRFSAALDRALYHYEAETLGESLPMTEVEDDFYIALAQACRHYIHELNDDQHDERRL